jgi:hypothetical protein
MLSALALSDKGFVGLALSDKSQAKVKIQTDSVASTRTPKTEFREKFPFCGRARLIPWPIGTPFRAALDV